MTDMSPFTYSRYLHRISAGACWQRPRRPLLISQARLHLLHWQSMTLFAFGRGNRQKAARKTGSSPSSHCYGARLVTNALVGYQHIGWSRTHWLVQIIQGLDVGSIFFQFGCQLSLQSNLNCSLFQA